MLFVCFSVFGREKTCRETKWRVEIKKIVISSTSKGSVGVFTASACVSRRQPLTEKALIRLKIQQLDQKLWLLEVSGASVGVSSRFS